jgi:hypothetical protein
MGHAMHAETRRVRGPTPDASAQPFAQSAQNQCPQPSANLSSSPMRT